MSSLSSVSFVRLKMSKGREQTEVVDCTHPEGKARSCGKIPMYLKVWCIIIGLRGGTEASCTIGQVSYCLLGEGALGDVGIIAILLKAGGSYIYARLQTVIHSN